MSYMADKDHIAITSGDTSTTRCKVSAPGCPVTLPIAVTQGEFSNTKRRIGPDREYCHRCGDTRRKLSLSYRDIPERPKVRAQHNDIISTASYRPVCNATGHAGPAWPAAQAALAAGLRGVQAIRLVPILVRRGAGTERGGSPP